VGQSGGPFKPAVGLSGEVGQSGGPFKPAVGLSGGCPYPPGSGRCGIAKGSWVPHPCRRFLSTGWVPQLSSPDRLLTRPRRVPHIHPLLADVGPPSTRPSLTHPRPRAKDDYAPVTQMRWLRCDKEAVTGSGSVKLDPNEKPACQGGSVGVANSSATSSHGVMSNAISAHTSFDTCWCSAW